MHLDNTLYDILEVSPRASAPVIKAAYRCLVQLNHPDKNPQDSLAANRLVRINQAYAVLSEPAKRQDYDRQIRLASVAIDRRGAVGPANKPSLDLGGVSKQPTSRVFAFRPLS